MILSCQIHGFLSFLFLKLIQQRIVATLCCGLKLIQQRIVSCTDNWVGVDLGASAWMLFRKHLGVYRIFTNKSDFME